MNNPHIKEREMENVVVLDMDGNMRIGEGGVVFHEQFCFAMTRMASGTSLLEPQLIGLKQ